MIELVANIVITASSVLLFGYWSRWAFMLTRNQKATLTAASKTRSGLHENRFSFFGHK